MGAAALGDFLRCYDDLLTPRLWASECRERFGDHLTDALLRAGMLEVNPRSNRYPCGQGKDRFFCSREVVPDPRESGTYLALCRYRPSRCQPIPVKSEDLVEYKASAQGIGRLVRKLMGLEGTFAATEKIDSHTVELGSFGAGADRREVFLAIGQSIGSLLMERRCVSCHSIVLTPSIDRVPLEWRHRHVPGEHVVLGSLMDLLDCRAGEIVLVQSPRDLTLRNARETVCLLEDGTGQKAISEVEYQDILRRASSLSLFIDGTQLRADGTYFASRRTLDGRLVQVSLSRREAMALIELVLRKGPLAPKQLAALSDLTSESALHIFRAARKLVDERLPNSVQ